MTRTDSSNQPAPLADLFTDYLRQQAAAQADGLGFPETAGEVVPHEAVPVQPVDPRQAWDNALVVVSHFPELAAHQPWTVPPDWPALVAAQEPALALAYSLGNFPQLVRNLHPLLAGKLPAVRVAPGRPMVVPALVEWAAHSHSHGHRLLAAGVLRLARHYEEANELLLLTADSPEWQAVQANEQAALAWHRGAAEEAITLWQGQESSVPVLFNRGMASLFLGRYGEARASLDLAVAALPENSAWHHLGRLYLALATSRI